MDAKGTAEVRKLKEAGMDVLRLYHMSYWRDMMPGIAARHRHPVEQCEDESFARLRKPFEEDE